MTSAKPVPGSASEPPVRGGELLRHLASPPGTRLMLTVVRAGLIAYAAFTVMVGVTTAFPANLVIVLALIGIMIAIWFFIYRPVRERFAGDPEPDALIALLVVPEGLVTYGGLDVYWREVEAVHVDEREYKGKGIDVHVIVTFNTDDVRDRATGNQRMAFVPFTKKIDLRLGVIAKSSRTSTSIVLREQCERVGVRFSSERRTLHSR